MNKIAHALVLIALGLCPVVALAAARAALGKPALLFNPSPSEPPGLYRLSTMSPTSGQLIAFKVPAPGRVYADTHLGTVARAAILKQIAAGAGALVCEGHGTVTVNGRVWGAVAATDRQGVPLPHWSGCQRLHEGQYFVLSNRIPNSFDSRYYGPVSQADLVGVYRPLWTE